MKHKMQFQFGILLLVLCTFCAARSAKTKDDLEKLSKTAHDECKKTNSITNVPNGNDCEVAAQMYTCFMESTQKCFLHCVFKGMGIVKEDQLDLMAMTTMMEKMAPPPMAARTKKAIEHCKDTAGTDMCDTSMKFLKCAYMYDKE
ncbi:hypothetical protein B566_EDAN016528, partial [Ephemera danica]